MQILVSFCNITRPGRPTLGLLDPASSRFRVVQLPPGLARGAGLTGLAASDRYLYAATQATNLTLRGRRAGPSELLVLDRGDLRLVRRYRFRLARDVHSLWLSDGVLYAVSTGTDELVELRLRGADVASESVRWRPPGAGPRADLHHLNAVLGLRDELLVVGFGKKAGRDWAAARAGFVVNATRDERLVSDIQQPHSLVAVDGRLAVCESRRRAVRILGGPLGPGLAGYTRGLCLLGGKLFVGTSVSRRASRSTGRATGAPDGGARCTVSRLSADSLEIEATIDLGAHGREIYDLLPIDRVERWPLVLKPAPGDRAAAIVADSLFMLARRLGLYPGRDPR